MGLFDVYIAVDWSAKNRPGPVKPKAHSIWVAELVTDPTGDVMEQHETYCRTRHEAVGHVQERLVVHTGAKRRVFMGFDFAYGYPVGFARALGLISSADPWLGVWRELADRIEDQPNNHSNRFEVASDLNARCGASTPGPFWGCPLGKRTSTLLPTSPIFPCETGSKNFLERLRITERRLLGVKSVWQLFGAGSVGSQTLLGIPAVYRLRDAPELRSMSKVWPFETGFVPNPTSPMGPFVLHVEIWPGIVKGMLDPDLKPRAC